jgi:hypothetical protein
MRMKNGFIALVVGAFLCGCSREHGQNNPASTAYSVSMTNVAGDWVLSAAPHAVTDVLPTNRFAASKILLGMDGSAKYFLVPVEQVQSASPWKSTWSVPSGLGSWGLHHWQDSGQDVWQVGLQTQAGEAGFMVTPGAAGELTLVYTSGGDTNAGLVYRRGAP